MMDLISREAAINAPVKMVSEGLDWVPLYHLRDLPSAQPSLDEWCTDCLEYNHERNCCPRWNRVIRQTLDDIEQNSWIPCTAETMPKNRLYVYVTFEPIYGLPDIGITYYDGDKWDAPKDGTPRKVIAWMPLPKPWKGEQNERFD